MFLAARQREQKPSEKGIDLGHSTVVTFYKESVMSFKNRLHVWPPMRRNIYINLKNFLRLNHFSFQNNLYLLIPPLLLLYLIQLGVY